MSRLVHSSAEGGASIPTALAVLAAKSLTKAQKEIVRRGCFSGDFSMATVHALRRKGLFELVISSPNGQCGFMELTPLGRAVRSVLQ